MDLTEILRSRIPELPDGEYMQGLKAVLGHIEVAEKHLRRGQRETDDTAFTDAIYRSNQAFEGSLKEAFRVLARQDPAGKRPFDIENYLQREDILRARVLGQMTRYRTEWRNPSAHDYRLDFNEDEALLAIVTVTAFAVVLVDQMIGCVAFETARSATQRNAVLLENGPLLEKVSSLLEVFSLTYHPINRNQEDIRESEVLGALAGFLNSAAPELRVQLEPRFGTIRPDLILSAKDQNVIVEIKRGAIRDLREVGLAQVSRYMEVSGIKDAILFLFSGYGVRLRKEQRSLGTGRLVILSSGNT